MKKILTIFLLFNIAYGQVENKIIQYNFLNKLSVGRQGNNDSAAYLQIGPNSGGNKGIGLPRVANTSVIVGSPFKGLQVFDESKDSLGYYNGSKWIYPGGYGSDTVINNIYHGSLAGLRALNNAAVKVAYVTDYGTGTFAQDDTDNTTPDNTWETIVSASGKRYKRQWDGKVLQVEWFGVVGDGVTNNTDSLQKAVSASYNRELKFTDGLTYLSNDVYLPGQIVVDLNGASVYPYTSPNAQKSIFTFQPIKNNNGVYGGGADFPVYSPNKKKAGTIEIKGGNIDLGNSLMGFAYCNMAGAYNSMIERFYVHDNKIRNFLYRPISFVCANLINDTTAYANNLDIIHNDIKYNPMSGLAIYANAARGDSTVQVYTIDGYPIEERLQTAVGKYFWIGSNMINDSLDNTGYAKTNTYFRLKDYIINTDDSTRATLKLQGGAYDATNGYVPYTDTVGIRREVIRYAMIIPIDPQSGSLLFTLPQYTGSAGATTLTRSTYSTVQSAYNANMVPGMKVSFASIAGTYTVTGVWTDSIHINAGLSGSISTQAALPYTVLAPCIYVFGNAKTVNIKDNFGYGGSHFVNGNGIGKKKTFSEELTNEYHITGNEAWYNWMTLENQSGNNVRATINPFNGKSVAKGDTSLVFVTPSNYRITTKDMGSGSVKAATLTSTADGSITNLNALFVGDIFKAVGVHEPFVIRDLYLNGSGQVTASIRLWDPATKSITTNGFSDPAASIGSAYRIYTPELGQEGSIKFTEISGNKFYYTMRNAGGTGYHASWQGYKTDVKNNIMENSEQSDVELHATELDVEGNTFKNYMFDGTQPRPSMTKLNSGSGRSHAGWAAVIAAKGIIKGNKFIGEQTNGSTYNFRGGSILLQAGVLFIPKTESLVITDNEFTGVGNSLLNVVDYYTNGGINYPMFYYDKGFITKNNITLPSYYPNLGLFKNIFSKSERITGNTIKKLGTKPAYVNVFLLNEKPSIQWADSTASYDVVVENNVYDTLANFNSPYFENHSGVRWTDNTVSLTRNQTLSNKTLDAGTKSLCTGCAAGKFLKIGADGATIEATDAPGGGGGGGSSLEFIE